MNILKNTTFNKWSKYFLEAISKPAIPVIIGWLVILIVNFLALYTTVIPVNTQKPLFVSLYFGMKLLSLIAFFWFVFRILDVLQFEMQQWLHRTDQRILQSILPMLSNSLRAAIILVMVNIIIPLLNLSGAHEDFFEKAARVLLIGILGWIFVQIVNGFEKVILSRYANDENSEIIERKLRTQIQIIKKIILTIGLVVTAASMLMVMDSVRKLGAGLLTTAGIFSVLGAFASQQTLSRLMAGLQMAFSQPIRIGDTVIVENEQGEIEEITFSYVVVKIWDLRRLILPTNYFLEKGFQNLTRSSTQLLGTVFLYVDHLFPIAVLRNELDKILQTSQWWDGQTGILNVTNMKEAATELRVLVSAANNAALGNLRYEIREQLIGFIAKNYPDYFPQQRTISNKL
jgi:small-conductance mechanosensitive channel